MRRLIVAIALIAALVAAPMANAGPKKRCSHVTAADFRPFSKAVWDKDRWERGKPRPKELAGYKRKRRCAAGAGHRSAIEARWGRDRLRYGRYRHVRLRRANINRVWGPPIWAPDWSTPPGSQMSLELIAALAEKTGDLMGFDIPGVTMAQMTIEESIRRPASAGVDAGGTIGYGLWAITWPHSNWALAKHGWSYVTDMWNPVRNAVAMVEVYRGRVLEGRSGTSAWYGSRGVTCWGCHYRGNLDLRLYLNGMTLREVLRTS